MHEKEIELFTKSLQYCQDEFYLDAIESLLDLASTYPKSELADDALYNVGLCFFNLNQFEKAIEYFQRVINEFPEATISVLEGGDEYGKTAAKCHYATLNCYLAMGRRNEIEGIIESLEAFPDSYIVRPDGSKLTYKEFAELAVSIFKTT